MVERLVHLGFEVRVELVRGDGEQLSVQISRDEAEQLELERGQIVYIRPAARADVRRGLASAPPGVRVADELLDRAAEARLEPRRRP